MLRSAYQKASVDLPSPGFFCFVAVLLLLGMPAGRAQTKLASTTVLGNHAFESGQILDWLSSKPGLPFSRAAVQRDSEAILARYHEQGYLHARVDSTRAEMDPDSTRAVVFFFLSEGGQAVVRAIELKGNASIPAEKLLSGMTTQVGSAFLPPVLESDLQGILRAYESSGFPLTRISIGDIRFLDDTGIAIELGIEEGVAAQVSELTIEGNRTTRHDVIVREARMNENEPYTEQLGERIKRRLERLELFSTVSSPQFYLSREGKGGLLIQVSEGNPNRFDGIVGYVPGTQGQKGFITGLIDVQLRNLFGTGRRLATRWYRENQTSQELSLEYREPWVASLPVNATIGFHQRKQDSTYIRQTYDISLALMITEELSAGFTFEQANVFATERAQNPVGGSHSTNFGLSVFFDSRDNPVLPASGVVYRTAYEVGTKILEARPPDRPRSEDRTGRLTFDMEYFLSPLFHQVIALGAHIRDFQSSIIEQSDLFRLGGAATLRGYRESQFLGSRLIWGTAEYRFLVGGRSFVYGFMDAGSIVLPDNPAAGLVKSEQTKIGYGVGIRVDTSLGLIGVSLALGEHDTMRTGKLHLRLINEF